MSYGENKTGDCQFITGMGAFIEFLSELLTKAAGLGGRLVAWALWVLMHINGQM